MASAKSVYIVTDVLKADDVTAVVTGDDDSLAKLHVQSIPVAFGSSKFRLGPGGLVAEQVRHFIFQINLVIMYITFTFLFITDDN